MGNLRQSALASFDTFMQADGGCDVTGLDEPASGLMFNHVIGDAIWSVMFDVARLTGYAVTPVGCPTCLPPRAGNP